MPRGIAVTLSVPARHGSIPRQGKNVQFPRSSIALSPSSSIIRAGRSNVARKGVPAGAQRVSPRPRILPVEWSLVMSLYSKYSWVPPTTPPTQLAVVGGIHVSMYVVRRQP